MTEYFEKEGGTIEIISEGDYVIHTPWQDSIHTHNVDTIAYVSANNPLLLVVKGKEQEKEIILPRKRTNKFKPVHDSIDINWRNQHHYLTKEDRIFRYTDYLKIWTTAKGKIRYTTKSIRPVISGQNNLLLTIPELNQYYVERGNDGKGVVTGFLGAGIGFEHYITATAFIQALAEARLSFPLPFPAPIARLGDYTLFNNLIGKIQFFNVKNRWSFGIGIGLSDYHYVRRHVSEVFPVYKDTLTFQDRSLNLSVPFSIKRNFGNILQLALNYDPSFMRRDEGIEFTYGHALSLSINFRIEMNRMRNDVMRFKSNPHYR